MGAAPHRQGRCAENTCCVSMHLTRRSRSGALPLFAVLALCVRQEVDIRSNSMAKPALLKCGLMWGSKRIDVEQAMQPLRCDMLPPEMVQSVRIHLVGGELWHREMARLEGSVRLDIHESIRPINILLSSCRRKHWTDDPSATWKTGWAAAG